MPGILAEQTVYRPVSFPHNPLIWRVIVFAAPVLIMAANGVPDVLTLS
jgi:hypothetical protein